VIATNADVLFSEQLVAHLGQLDPCGGRLYRAPRHDFRCTAAFSEDASRFEWTIQHDLGPSLTNASGDFTAATASTWSALGGYCESPGHLRHLDSELVVSAMFSGMEIVSVPPVYHRDHPESTKFSTAWKPAWGIEDEGLAKAMKIMPRKADWGHRDCVLSVVKPRLAVLQPVR
jgi:hypothetical protein